MNYILGFNIGNTNTELGFFNKEDIIPVKIYSYKTEKNAKYKKFTKHLDNFINVFKKDIDREAEIEGLAFSSVVPEVNSLYHDLGNRAFGIKSIEVNHLVNLGITLNYDDLSELGADRITNAVAAYNEYKRDCIIVDLGTAITFCVLLENGVFDGGLIAPGVGVAIDALAEKASRLIKVNFQDPKKIVAKNTENALKSGFFYGWISLVSGILAGIEREYSRDFYPILTGGYSKIVGASLGRECHVDPLLTLKGIKYIYNMNI